MKIKISIVIGTFNQAETLKQVLPVYENQLCSKDLFEVILIDSNSADNTHDFLNEYNPNYNFKYKIQANNGKASARNEGVKLAVGTYIIITDSDMIPGPTFIQGHLDAHLNSKKECCFEGLAWNMNKLEWPIIGAELSAQVGSFPRHMSKLGWYYFLTGNLSMPKSLFEANSGFNETFQSYGWEDLELGYRLSKEKVPLFYLKTSVNYHYHVISKEEEIKRCEKKGDSSLLFLKLHPELKWFLGFNPLSKLVFPRIRKESKLYQLFQNLFNSKISIKHNLGFWFLKEWHYLKGALKY
jgi:glycosyltransferase involved in cell wall biosynthesis